MRIAIGGISHETNTISDAVRCGVSGRKQSKSCPVIVAEIARPAPGTAARSSQWQTGQTKDGRPFFAIPGSESGLFHMTDQRQCSCQDRQRSRNVCKHMRAVRLWRAAFATGAVAPKPRPRRHGRGRSDSADAGGCGLSRRTVRAGRSGRGFGWPQAAQAAGSPAPQLMQNLAAAGISTPHNEQLMVINPVTRTGGPMGRVYVRSWQRSTASWDRR
jgi:hypothetical protein